MTSVATSKVMRANRSRDTTPELRLRKELHRRGLRYFVCRRLVFDRVGVRPDLLFPRRRVAVFLDGCYWHGCPEHWREPKTNVEFWRAKVARNRARDATVDALLEEAGWTVVRAWEHEPVDEVADRVEAAL